MNFSVVPLEPANKQLAIAQGKTNVSALPSKIEIDLN
jgi:hypothetical protein